MNSFTITIAKMMVEVVWLDNRNFFRTSPDNLLMFLISSQNSADERDSSRCAGHFHKICGRFPGNLQEQSKIVFQRLNNALALHNATLDDVVKLNLFIASDSNDISQEFHSTLATWAELAPNSKPAMTPVQAYELSQPGLLIQADCIAKVPN